VVEECFFFQSNFLKQTVRAYPGSNNCFQQEKLQEKKLFPTQPKKNDVKNYQIVEKKKWPTTVFASLKESNRLKQFFFQIIDHYYHCCILVGDARRSGTCWVAGKWRGLRECCSFLKI
jgi:hypothetical protein